MRPSSLLSFLWGSDEQPVPAAHDQARLDPNASYRRLSDQALVGVYSCDASGVIQYYNNRAAELWGRRPTIGDTDERFCGAFALYRADGSFMPHEYCPVADVLSGRVPGVFDAEVHIERPDKSRVIVIVNIAPMVDDDGRIVGAINSFYDMNDLSYAKP
jgi:PAS domain-containing protein